MVACGVFPLICVGSAVTLSACTVIARIVPSAVVMLPRSAGIVMLCSLFWLACFLNLRPSRPCS